MKHLICIFFLYWITFHLSAQNYETRFQLSSINCVTQQVCYDVQLKSNGTLNFNLAGQNYRIFYNSSLAAYISGQSLLPSQYQGFTLIQDIQDQNADDINGSLTFESTLGFLNFAMDLNDIQNGGIVLSTNEWTSTATLCFRAEGDVLNNIDSCLELVWGRDGLTNSYATAFVEVSRWVAANNTTNSNGILYDDLNAEDGASSCLVIPCQPTAIFVADITVNETVDSAQLQVCIPVPTTEDVTVNLTTADSTAIASSDYTAQTNTLVTITTGQTCSSVSLPIINDMVSELAEVFKVILSNPSSNATISGGHGLVTIADDEQIPTVSIQDVTVNEDAGVAISTICLSNISSFPTSMKLNTADSTAVSGIDYTTIADLLVTIPAGTQCVMENIDILDDFNLENTEMLKITLSNISANATFEDPNALSIILDNDTTCKAKAPIISGN